MNRRLLRWLNLPILLLAALLAIALQTSVFSISLLRFLEPQSCLLLLIWFALRRGFTEGGIVCLLLGHFLELHSGAPRGFFLGVFVLLFLAIRVLDRYTVFSSLRNLLWLTFGTAALFATLTEALLIWLDPLPHSQWRAALAILGAAIGSLPRAAATALMGNWVYGWIQSLDHYCFNVEAGLDDTPWDPRDPHESGSVAGSTR